MRIEDAQNMLIQRTPTEPSMSLHTGKEEIQDKPDAKSAIFAGGYNLRIRNAGNYDKNSIQDETLAEELARKGDDFTDVQSTKRNLSMAVAGFSVEDLEGARAEGYDVSDMEPDKIITVIDSIKMHLAMGGQDISKMGGLSESEIAEMTGDNTALSSVVEKALVSADLPAEDEIIEDGVVALKKAGELEDITPGAIEFLVKNKLEPTIENVYRGTFVQPVGGAPADEFDENEINALLSDAKKRVDAADLVMDEEQTANIKWMLERQLPVTTDNIAYINDLKTKEPILSVEAVADRIAEAVGEGRRPQEAYIISGYSMADIAAQTEETLLNVSAEQAAGIIERGEKLTPEKLRREMIRDEKGLEKAGEVTDKGTEDNLSGNYVKARRLLEETRLVMSQQANISLLKRGVAIDTTELTELVSKLKDIEKQFERNVLASPDEKEITDKELEVRKELFDSTLTQVRDLKEMPAVLLGRIPDVSLATISDLHREGSSMAAAFKKAGESYETMATEVRRDLGDSIRKAFRNVDDILAESDIEVNDSNRRAVRILAYNRNEITRESVLQIKNSDELVSRVLKNLTPAVVSDMIREGENPLDLSMEELEEKTEAIKAVSSSGAADEKFSEFLYKAQKNNELTQEERDAFVGVYRLIYQVEKTDGAVIGQLLAQGAELTLRNLMTAVRTRRHENREYVIDDDFGFAEFDKSVLSITDQIEMAFQTRRMKDAGDQLTPGKLRQFEKDSYLEMTPDAFAEALEELSEDSEDERLQKAYDKQQLERVVQAVRSEERVYEMLTRFDLPQTPGNLETFSSLLADRNGMYRRLFAGNDRRVFGTEDDGVREGTTGLDDVITDLIRDFGDAVRSPEEMEKAQQNLEEVAENVMKTMIVEQPVGTINVRGMQISVKQIRAMGETGRKTETYSVPVVTKDGIANMTLKIRRGNEENRGLVDMMLDMDSQGIVRASFRYDTDGVYGSVKTTLSSTLDSIRNISDELTSAIEQEAGIASEITFRRESALRADGIFEDDAYDAAYTDRAAGDGYGPEVQTRVLYGIARSFIRVVSSMQ